VRDALDDIDTLIARLTGPLSPPHQEAFRRIAADAGARIPCAAEPAIGLAVTALAKSYFDAAHAGGPVRASFSAAGFGVFSV
jgi:hypothetical protein